MLPVGAARDGRLHERLDAKLCIQAHRIARHGLRRCDSLRAVWVGGGSRSWHSFHVNDQQRSVSMPRPVLWVHVQPAARVEVGNTAEVRQLLHRHKPALLTSIMCHSVLPREVRKGDAEHDERVPPREIAREIRIWDMGCGVWGMGYGVWDMGYL